MKTATHYYTNEHGAEFGVRVWFSVAADGWFWTVFGDGMDRRSSHRAWATEAAAYDMAIRFIDRRFA